MMSSRTNGDRRKQGKRKKFERTHTVDKYEKGSWGFKVPVGRGPYRNEDSQDLRI